MREGLEVVEDAESLARLLGGALDRRRAEEREGRLQVMRESRVTVARVVPVDEVTRLAAGLNRLDRMADGPPVEVVFVDRWAAAAMMSRGDAFSFRR